MAQVIDVNTGTLKGQLDTIDGELRKLSSEADRLENITAALGRMWEGDARDAFTAAAEGDIRQLREIIRSLQKYTGRSQDACTSYEKCERSVSQLITDIRV